MRFVYRPCKTCVVGMAVVIVSCTTSQPKAPSVFADFPNKSRDWYEATGSKFMIASQGKATTLAAREMFLKGGNIMDAAVAASFAISVERPQSTGIGGGGFLLYHQSSAKTIAADFREQAPAKAHQKMFQDSKGNVIKNLSTQGALAAGVPGMVAGMIELHKKYGKLPLKTVLEPAIMLAEQGFKVYPHLAAALRSEKKVLWSSPAARSIFFHSEDKPLVFGDILKQPDLAKTLKTIAEKGRPGFYQGWVAQAILQEEKRLGGIISQQDLDTYEVKYRTPVSGDYHGYDIVSMPPPSSGGTHIVEMLNILEGFPLQAMPPYSPEAIHYTASAMQLAYRDRAKYLGDTDFIEVPLKTLTSNSYATELRKSIDPSRAKKSSEIGGPEARSYESLDTTHFTIADSDGNVVVSTQTINGWFGSGVVVPGTGIVLNNEMDDFSSKPGVANKFGLVGGEENAVVGGKRPLSSMSPTIVFKKGKPVLALGSPAGSQIINCVMLTALNYLTYKMPLYDAVTSLRYHHQWLPDQLLAEAPGLPAATTDQLKALGYDVKLGEIGCKVQAVAYEGDSLRGVSDPRGEGFARGEGSIPANPDYQDPNAAVSAD